MHLSLFRLPYKSSLLISSVSFASNSAHIVLPSEECSIQVWDSVTGKALGEPLREHTTYLEPIAVPFDGTRIASCPRDRNIFITMIKDSQNDSWKQKCRRSCACLSVAQFEPSYVPVCLVGCPCRQSRFFICPGRPRKGVNKQCSEISSSCDIPQMP